MSSHTGNWPKNTDRPAADGSLFRSAAVVGFDDTIVHLAIDPVTRDIRRDALLRASLAPAKNCRIFRRG
jgi:hypothetical protein